MKKLFIFSAGLIILFHAGSCTNSDDTSNETSSSPTESSTSSSSSMNNNSSTTDEATTVSNDPLSESEIQELFKKICYCEADVQQSGAFAEKVREEYKQRSSSMTSKTQKQFEVIEKSLQKLGQKAEKHLGNEDYSSGMSVVEKAIESGYAEHYGSFSLAD